MLIQNMFLLLTEDRNSVNTYVKLSMKNSQHRSIASGHPAQTEYLTLFSRSICPEKIKMCSQNIDKEILEMMNFSLVAKW